MSIICFLEAGRRRGGGGGGVEEEERGGGFLQTHWSLVVTASLRLNETS